ncbi:hypothetical protein A4R35_03705 [Thermogemmatispora tikiterensis]|uniref:HTH cro/C1-type domain-containing protein n=2 Tax=Thermogemmatispora tikiterensis TaxID=1825093 RepID=A0A328VAD1_9CHLR|nr:hypothetical protein A4R35_03705 [Thermogemmatispora tikiterensis]
MYHYGIIIREYRERAGMTQAQLAARWPKSERFGGGEGVSWKYIQDIEHGRKRIDDQETLRKVCSLLHIPLWRVGLSEYDPFTDTLTSSQCCMQVVDLMELTLRQAWTMRKSSLLGPARGVMTRLGTLWASFLASTPPALQKEVSFQRLQANYHCLQGVLAVDAMQYHKAITHYYDMYQIAQHLQEPALLAHALMNIGVEYDRQGQTLQSIQYLEQARDWSFEAPKAWRVLVHAYLSRAYARSGDLRRFLQANDMALRWSHCLYSDYIDDPDGVYYSTGNILAERSAGYLLLDQPHSTLALRKDVITVLQQGQESRVAAWMSLDWAQAYLLLGEVEACVSELRQFHRDALRMGSAHALQQARSVLASLERNYGDARVVKALREELLEDAGGASEMPSNCSSTSH